MSKKKTAKLSKDTWSVGIHGVTGQDTEEGTLAAGTLVRDVEVEGAQTYFAASTDNGKTWFRQRTYGAIELAR